ncbi:MAG: hypothetical protein ABR540_01180 [Acidimicrobiales bacterium]
MATSFLLVLVAGTTAPLGSGPAAAVAAAGVVSGDTTVTLNAVDRGWFGEHGLHPDNPNYAVGSSQLAQGRMRNFFVFDLSSVSGSVVAANVSAANPSADPGGDTYTLREVTTSTAVLSAEATTATAVYDDLGNGPVYGSVGLGDATLSPVVVPLNDIGVRAVQSAVGDTLAFGGDYAPSAAGSAVIFADTDGLPASAVQLVLTVRSGPVTLKSPYSVWTRPDATHLDGFATWMAPVNDPAPAAGQEPADYLYASMFSFTDSTAVGFVGLVTGPGGKYAVASIVGPDGEPRNAVVPFAWSPGRLYLPFIYQVSPGSWGAWVYDDQAGTWVTIGGFSLPQAWGKLAPVTVTAAGWVGAATPSCAAYPHADVFIQAPIGFAGSSAVQATLTSAGTTAGDCPPLPPVDEYPWAFYRLGDLVPFG